MYNETVKSIVIFIVCLIVLLALFVVFIVTIIYRYKRNQHLYFKEISSLRVTHENDLLKGQLEMQEYTFANISREIHDNVGQKLSLAKLLLNTQDFKDAESAQDQVVDSVVLISEAMDDLSDISKSMSSEIILENGLLKAIEFEISQLQKSGLYKADLITSGEHIFLDFEKELIIFRIVQESLHNIIKHANASYISIRLDYDDNKLALYIEDNGNGFELDNKGHGTGLVNIRTRTSILGGKFFITSTERGTCLNFEIPIKSNTHA